MYPYLDSRRIILFTPTDKCDVTQMCEQVGAAEVCKSLLLLQTVDSGFLYAVVKNDVIHQRRVSVLSHKIT